LTELQTYRTDATLCIPDPQFGHTSSHTFRLRSGVPIQEILLSSSSGVGECPGGSVAFEVWSRFYYPNVRDQLLAKVSEPCMGYARDFSLERIFAAVVGERFAD